jgi:hypothetical protein
MRPARATPLAILVAVLVAVLAPACARDDGGAPNSAGLATLFDSTTTDSVIARTAGSVPEEAMRGVVEEVRIAPAADDTSLFGEVFEFDVGADGRFYVFDQAGRSLLIFTPAGALERRVGRQGAGPGEFNSNGGMVVLADGRVAQWDSRNGRISFFSAGGDFDSSWVVPTGFFTSNGLRTDDSGAVYLYRAVTAPREGEILGRFGLVRLGEGGAFGDSLVPPDLRVERITYVAQKEGSTSAMSPTHSPRFQWQWHPDGHFVSVATSRYEVEVGRPGRAVRIVRDAPAIPVPDAERAYDQELITFQMRSNVPGWVWRGPAIPGEKPPVSALSVARDGRIWVRVATPSEEIPEAERDPQVEGRRPVRRFRDAVEYEVFERDGTFAGRVRLPANAQWMEADADRVWYLDRDADGLPAVVRARVEPGLR